jgi:RNA polymerase sigma-70 factor (ECF subfamily)
MVTLYYFEENSVQQISKVTGFSVSNVKVKLFRLRKKLRQLVETIASKEALVY